MNETFDIQGRTLCAICCEEFLREQGDLAAVQAVRRIDPTVCVNCGADNGVTPHGELLQQPTCATCIDFFRNRPFPKWVNAFFLALAALVVVSFACNWRFIQGHLETKAAFASMASGEMPEAAAEMAAAAAHVPESKELRELDVYFQGVLCLSEDNCEKAEQLLAKCANFPPSFGVSQLREQAAVGAAFNRKDYDRFLQIAEERAKRAPQDPIAQAQVASALACLYAVRGDDELQRRAEAKLEAAKTLGKEAIDEARYEERIRHRLQTREIISAEEYLRRFPTVQKFPKQSES